MFKAAQVCKNRKPEVLGSGFFSDKLKQNSKK